MKFYGELLIFVLLFIINLRVFFVNSVKRDPIVAFAPVTFILAICQIFSWGIDIFTTLGVVLSFLVLLSNFHALFRYTERLYVDHYSVLMKVWATFTSILSIGAVIFLILYPPVSLKNKHLNIDETKYRYTGNFTAGMEPAKSFDKVSGILYEYKMKPAFEFSNKDEENKDDKKELAVVEEKNKPAEIVLFVPDKRGDTFNYRPYLQLLASKGYTVCSCDFFSSDCKWFYSFADMKAFRRLAMVYSSLNNSKKFMANRELYTFNIARECEQLLKMITEKYGEDSKIFIVSDGMSNEAVYEFGRKYRNNVTGTFQLNSVPEYLTPGYGFIAETAPILNASMNLPKERNFETPKILVERTLDVIKF